jgi:hypothetical protein
MPETVFAGRHALAGGFFQGLVFRRVHLTSVLSDCLSGQSGGCKAAYRGNELSAYHEILLSLLAEYTFRQSKSDQNCSPALGLEMKLVADFRIDLSRFEIVRASEGQAVIEEESPVANVQSLNGHGPALYHACA